MKNLTKERYLELKYFCQQYPEKKKRLNEHIRAGERARTDTLLIEIVAEGVDRKLAEYIIKQVSTGIPYEKLEGCPCGRRQFYDKRNEFYRRLSEVH